MTAAIALASSVSPCPNVQVTITGLTTGSDDTGLYWRLTCTPSAMETDIAIALAGVGAPGGAIDGGNATSSYTNVGTIDGGTANG